MHPLIEIQLIDILLEQSKRDNQIKDSLQFVRLEIESTLDYS